MIPTCDDCGEQWLDEGLAKRLDDRDDLTALRAEVERLRADMASMARESTQAAETWQKLDDVAHGVSDLHDDIVRAPLLHEAKRLRAHARRWKAAARRWRERALGLPVSTK
ncbi:MAG TPA: hypothetical protein VD931_16405 [Baekduia sp.]|nr:hypothetical protein [Baekduia sp.]